MSVRVAGSLWSVPPDRRDAEAARLVDAGLEVWHWDRADGSLGPAGGFDALEAIAITQRTGIRAEAHLMLIDPRPELAAWTAFAEVVVVHLESPHWREAVVRIRAAGRQAGVAVSPATPVPDDLDDDLAVLVMTVAPGTAGSGFRHEQLERLRAVSGHPLRGVDGSVDASTADAARDAGANWLVSGTALTGAPDARAWLAAASGH